ncbi:hypothetical protein EYF80_049356 [Liparis tanakae]|uniref:Uncharacterized protein n=1 Tax=Liparis tanakae TaxID=230148 RepID=A0A4Z2FH08_9TELE|nr:hypothetical protein EYF80_049356 [Liparis tanakae]
MDHDSTLNNQQGHGTDTRRPNGSTRVGGGEPEERQRARQKQSGRRPPGGGTRSGGRRTGTGSELRRAETVRDGVGTKELKPSETEHRELGQAGIEIANWDRRNWSRPGRKRLIATGLPLNATRCR